MATTRILYAYCEELDESVSIDTARRHFVCEEPALSAYHFYCDDEHCASQADPVRITGVNYRVPASESAKYVTAHYRLLDSHHELCRWNQERDADIGLLPGETADEAKQRKLRRKLHDLVTIFDPSLGDDVPGKRRPAKDGAEDGPAIAGPRTAGKPRDPDKQAGGYNRTNQLGRLVETYREARATLSQEEFNELTIRVVNEGTLRLGEYFCRLARATYATRNRVVHGGATLVKRYGRGFRLKFYDKVADTSVFLYVSQDEMAAYRFRKYLELALEQADTVKYFTVYAIATLKPGKSEKTSDLVVDDLRHLTLIPGPEKAA